MLSFEFCRSTGGRRGGGRRSRPRGGSTLVKPENEETEKGAENKDIGLLQKRVTDKIEKLKESQEIEEDDAEFFSTE